MCSTVTVYGAMNTNHTIIVTCVRGLRIGNSMKGNIPGTCLSIDCLAAIETIGILLSSRLCQMVGKMIGTISRQPAFNFFSTELIIQHSSKMGGV